MSHFAWLMVAAVGGGVNLGLLVHHESKLPVRMLSGVAVAMNVIMAAIQIVQIAAGAQ